MTRVARFGWFGLGILVTLLGLAAGGYVFIKTGGISMVTTAKPLPLERTLARLALHASIGRAAEMKDPLPATEEDMLAGVREYRGRCAVCHGIPGQPRTAISEGMFPKPPQLFETKGMVTNDAEGVTYWKVTHGIRLSGMPGFERTLSDSQRWQVTMLLAHADKLSPRVRAALTALPVPPAARDQH
jgi:thiosulfate dehydrogenase